MRIVYTGATGGSLSPVQRFGTWLKAEKKIRRDEIAINTIPDGFGDIFRGPHIFKRNGTRYMILGTNGADKDGCAVIYREENSLSGEDLLYEAQEESSEVSYEGIHYRFHHQGRNGHSLDVYKRVTMGNRWDTYGKILACFILGAMMCSRFVLKGLSHRHMHGRISINQDI